MLISLHVPAKEKTVHCTMMPPICFMVYKVVSNSTVVFYISQILPPKLWSSSAYLESPCVYWLLLRLMLFSQFRFVALYL